MTSKSDSQEITYTLHTPEGSKTPVDPGDALVPRTYTRDELTEIRKDIHDLYDKRGDLYKDFIVILGIFITASFSLNGSIQILGNLFSKFNAPAIENLGFILLAGGFYLLIMYFISGVLLSAIGSLFLKPKEEYKPILIFEADTRLAVIVFSGICIVIGLVIFFLGALI
ncbi:MAG: hypothetical protein LBV19_10635 [Streptococcaceae bacterium]|jgi:hypothetical protein|nr:hypothetical protein [Streptococcaceae bacterium]